MKKKLFYFFMAVVFINGSVIYPYFTLTRGYSQGLPALRNAVQSATTSPARNGTVSHKVKTVLPIPSKSIVLSRTAKSVKVLWNPEAFTNSTHLEIVRTPPFPDGNKIVNAKNSSYIDQDVVDGQEYTYSVSMVDAQGRKSPVKTMTARFGSRTGTAAFGKASKVEFDGFKLNFKGREFKKDKSIRVRISPNTVDEETMLQASELFEVTLPDSEQPSEPVVADIFYNTINMPKGYSENDLKVFVRHDAATPWELAKIVSIDKTEKIIHAEIPHFSEIVAGFVSAPEASETRANVNTKLPKMTMQNPFSSRLPLNPPSPNISGSLNQSIPVVLPSGIAGMTPDVGLIYNNEQGNGLCGIGWNLTAADCIQRGAKSGVYKFTKDDSFMYNGTELVPIQISSEPYEYRAKKEGGFAKFFFYQTGNYWKIVKDGNAAFYGRKPNDSVSGDIIKGKSVTGNVGTIRWNLSSRNDLDQNSVSYYYISENGDKLLDYIAYDHFIVDFVYTNRADVIEYNGAGFPCKITKRLKEIEIRTNMSGGSTFNVERKYCLSYTNNEVKDSFLKGVDLVRGDQTVISRMDLAYQNYDIGFANGIGWNTNASTRIADVQERLMPMDINGDGLIDLVCDNSGLSNNSNGRFTLYKNTGYGYSNAGKWNIMEGSTTVNALPAERLEFSDFNNDGKPDIIFNNLQYDSSSTVNQWKYYVNTGTSFKYTNSFSLNGSYDPSRVTSMDINGDGKSEWVVNKACLDGVTGNAWDVYTNTAAGFAATPVEWAFPAITDQDKISFSDMNGDGKVDLVVDTTDVDGNNSFTVYFNTNNGFDISKPHYFTGTIPANQCKSIVDMNMDGLPDYTVYQDDHKIMVYPNTGTNFSSAGYSISTPTNLSVDDIDLKDMNGDGRPDLTVKTLQTNGNPLMQIWLNNRTNFIYKKTIELNAPESWRHSLTDIDGDGIVDSVINNDDGSYTIRKGIPNYNGMLIRQSVDHMTLKYEYGRANNGLGYGKTVLKAVSMTNELPATDPGMLSKKIVFNYELGKNDKKNGISYGFGKVTTTDNLSNKNVVWYDQTSEDMVGSITKTENYAGLQNRLVSRSTNNYFVVSFYNNQSKTVLVSDAANTSFALDGTEELTTKTVYQYYGRDITTGTAADSYYLLYKTINLNKVVNNVNADVADDTAVTYEYTGDDTSANLNITPKLCHTLSSFTNNGERISESKVFYDNQNLSSFNGRARVSSKQEWAGFNSSGGDLWKTLQNTYSTNRPWQLVNTVDYVGTPMQTSTSYQYDDATHRFLVKSDKRWSNDASLSNITATVPELVWGSPLMVRDSNNQTSYFRYDRKDRVIAVYSSGDEFNGGAQTGFSDYNEVISTIADKPSVYYVYGTANANTFFSAVYKRKFLNDNGLTSWEYPYIAGIAFLDGFGRQLQNKVYHQDQSGNARFIVSGKVIYDQAGRSVTNYEPVSLAESSYEYFTDYHLYGSGSGTPVYSLYDDLGRNIETGKKSGSDSMINQTAYDGLHKVVTCNAAMNIKETINDDFGRVVKVADYIGKEYIPGNAYTSLRFGYDRKGNLLGTTNSDNSVIAITYDSLNRKIAMNDPDMGTWQYKYNQYGQMTNTLDAKGECSVFKYDIAGRLTNKSYINGSGSDVTYIYGKDANLNNNGRVIRVIDGPGSEEYAYNNDGSVATNWRSVGSRTFISSSTHDLLGRITELAYPHENGDAGIKVRYFYQNFSGLLDRIVRVVDGINDKVLLDHIYYDEKGRRTALGYGNGVNTHYTYDTFKGMLANCTIENGAPIKNINYTFDNAGNLLTRNDEESTTTHQYDDLNRLTRTTFIHNDPVNVPRYDNYFVYDAVGNIIHKDVNDPANPASGNRNYEYGTVKPHAVKSFTGPYLMDASARYTNRYDANGNMTNECITYVSNGLSKQAVKKLVWDKGNSLSSVDWNGNIHTYYYDSSGERVMKFKNEGEPDETSTLYISGTAQFIGSGPAVFAVFDGVNRIASIKCMAGTTNTYFTHTDQVGSTILVTTEIGQVYQKLIYKSFGDIYKQWKDNIWKNADTGAFTEIGNFAFTGQEVDMETGLVYYGARYYDPFIGRFISPDTTVQDPYDSQTYGRYTYCGNNPIKYNDPSGHLFIIDDLIVSAISTVVATVVNTVNNGAFTPTLCLSYGLLFLSVHVSYAYNVGTGTSTFGAGVGFDLGGGVLSVGIDGSQTYSQGKYVGGSVSLGLGCNAGFVSLGIGISANFNSGGYSGFSLNANAGFKYGNNTSKWNATGGLSGSITWGPDGGKPISWNCGVSASLTKVSQSRSGNNGTWTHYSMTPTIGVGLNGAWGTSLKDAFNQAKKEAWDDPNKHWSVSASVAKPRYEYTADEHAASGGLKDLQAQREQIDEASGTPSNPKADLRQGGSAHIPNTAEEIRAYCERNKYTGELNGYLKGAGQSIDPIANFNDAADSFKNGSILGVALGVLGMIPGGSEVKLVGKEILQVGGNILKPGTLKVLGMTKEEGRNAMHALKEYIGVRHDSHGIIMKDGNYFNKAGELLGNLKDFLQ